MMGQKNNSMKKGSCRGFFLFLLCMVLHATAAEAGPDKKEPGTISGLNAGQFKKYWTVESEAPDYRVSFSGDTVEIVSPKGLTLWRNEKMRGDVSIEYDACLMDEGQAGDRLSDLNCFWMASDPLHPDDIFKRKGWRKGIFPNCYTLRLYYMGYGGNSNKTTRFRRYDGDERGVTEAARRPAILTEYTDAAHLNVANRWRHIRITTEGNRVCYYIDGERLVDFRDPEPLQEGWFGFRTTWSRVRLTNFRYTATTHDCEPVVLRWIEEPAPAARPVPVSFGVPFAKGTVSGGDRFAVRPVSGNGAEVMGPDEEALEMDFRPLAYWPDGSVKWGGFSGTLPGAPAYHLDKKGGRSGRRKAATDLLTETSEQYIVHTGRVKAYIPKRSAGAVIDSLSIDGRVVATSAALLCAVNGEERHGRLDSLVVERLGAHSVVLKLCGRHWEGDLPFLLRLYFFVGSPQICMVHTFLYDRDANKDFITALGVRFAVPMREEPYNRHVAFSGADGGVWSEPVQPLTGRRVLFLNEMEAAERHTPLLYAQQMSGKRIPEREAFSPKYQAYLDQWASWDGYRLSQLNDMGYTLRKRAKHLDATPWIGTFSGTRSSGSAFLGDVSGGIAVGLHDFWQSYPSTLEVSGATVKRGEEAALTVWLWSPEAEPMDLRHYDTEAHGLDAAYEDVQDGMSTPYGIGRTSTLVVEPLAAYPGKAAFAAVARELVSAPQLACTPEYLHRQRAFGVWSLPDRSDEQRCGIEDLLEGYIEYYRRAVEDHHWYGFWNYGDVMHTYDPNRHEWLYDVGGFAWDNTELASNSWLWYSYLRTGRADLWRMAVAMTRHTAEVDVYHFGPYAGLGSRHNVSHWGCGAKEARISQAAWNRFYYYLSGGDERTGELMTEVRDVDTLLYRLDPMRLAQPRELYPCTAPARLRIGPDWLAYAGNWMTEWERTGDCRYRDKILAGMKSISALPNGIFTGPKALGYDPATGVISYEGDSSIQNTNHLLPIMGGFELMNEMMEMLPEEVAWRKTWLELCRDYRIKADTISHNHFRIPRLAAYAYYITQDKAQYQEAWKELLGHPKGQGAPRWRPVELSIPEVPAGRLEERSVSTNGVATWSLDAIYMLEVCP